MNDRCGVFAKYYAKLFSLATPRLSMWRCADYGRACGQALSLRYGTEHTFHHKEDKGPACIQLVDCPHVSVGTACRAEACTAPECPRKWLLFRPLFPFTYSTCRAAGHRVPVSSITEGLDSDVLLIGPLQDQLHGHGSASCSSS
jgi:hypothetical protein